MLNEMEEMKELEKAAEDLQAKADQESLSSEETEEEKRERVRRELEKVSVLFLPLFFSCCILKVHLIYFKLIYLASIIIMVV